MQFFRESKNKTIVYKQKRVLLIFFSENLHLEHQCDAELS